MIATILIVGLAFYWLLQETDYLRINLMTCCQSGDSCPWRLQDNQVTREMKEELIDSWFSRNGDKYSHMIRCHLEQKRGAPLCGWGYAYQYRNFQPEYKIELIDGTCRNMITSNSIPHLKDAFRVWRNPRIKVKLA